MTGAYLRANRGDKFENVEVEHLTDEELEEKFLTRDPKELVSWMKMLCAKLRQIEPLLVALEKEGVIAYVRE